MKIRVIIILMMFSLFLFPKTISTITADMDIQENHQTNTNYQGVEIIRPKPGHLYLFNIVEIPIATQKTIIIGEITCVAEQIPIYPFTVRWEFTDWKYGIHTQISDNLSTPYWRCTYATFNFGTLEIKAVFKNGGGTVMSSDTMTVNKFL